MIIQRRLFLAGLVSALAAPAIVPIENLMKLPRLIKPKRPFFWPSIDVFDADGNKLMYDAPVTRRPDGRYEIQWGPVENISVVVRGEVSYRGLTLNIPLRSREYNIFPGDSFHLTLSDLEEHVERELASS